MAVEGRKPEKMQKKAKRQTAKKRTTSSQKNIKIKLVRSLIGYPRAQREVVKGLGLRKVNSEVVRRDSPEIWGMIRKIPHLLKVETVEEK